MHTQDNQLGLRPFPVSHHPSGASQTGALPSPNDTVPQQNGWEDLPLELAEDEDHQDLELKTPSKTGASNRIGGT